MCVLGGIVVARVIKNAILTPRSEVMTDCRDCTPKKLSQGGLLKVHKMAVAVYDGSCHCECSVLMKMVIVKKLKCRCIISPLLNNRNSPSRFSPFFFFKFEYFSFFNSFVWNVGTHVEHVYSMSCYRFATDRPFCTFMIGVVLKSPHRTSNVANQSCGISKRAWNALAEEETRGSNNSVWFSLVLGSPFFQRACGWS